MRVPGSLAVISAAVLAACGFNPSGGELAGDDDVTPGDGGGDPADGTVADAPAVTADAPAVAIDAAIDARPACPADYALAIGGARYVKRSAPTGIDAARTDCGDDLAGRTALATFEQPADLGAVMSALAASTDQLWVGAKCQWVDWAGCAGAASWSWDSGAPVAGSLWMSPEPDNPFSETTLITGRRSGQWTLMTVGTIFPLEGRPYVCECAE